MKDEELKAAKKLVAVCGVGRLRAEVLLRQCEPAAIKQLACDKTKAEAVQILYNAALAKEDAELLAKQKSLSAGTPSSPSPAMTVSETGVVDEAG